MTSTEILQALVAKGVELRVRSGSLSIRGQGQRPDSELLGEASTHKAELITLLNGSTCRHCRGPIVWRPRDAHVSLADGTSLHSGCWQDFEVERTSRAAERAVAPALQTDPAEVALRGELDQIEQEAAR